MGQKCSALLKEKEEEALYSVAKEEEEVEEEEEKSFSGKPSSSRNSFLEVRKNFLRFSKEGAVVSKDDDDDDEDDKNAREERAPFFYQDEAEEKRGGGESAPRVVGNVSLVVQEEEEEEEEEEKKKRQRVGSKSPPKRFRWTVGEKELREATQNGDGEVTSTIFVADAHREFRLALKNSVEVEGGAAKALVSARLECCPPSSSKAANAVDVAATMRVSLEFSKRGENGINDESRGSIVLREAYTRQVLNQGECLVLRDFFKSDIAESNATKLTTTKNKATTSTKDRFQLVCEVDFDSLDSVALSERDDEDDINTFNSSAIVAYCVSLSPLLFVFENFLHESECEFLRTLADKDLKRSRVTDGKLSNGRTSSSCFLIGAKGKEDVVKTIERRMLDAIRSTPVLTTRRFDTLKLKGSEPMQIVRYGKNEKYTSHFDNKAGSFRRVATFMCYLSDQCEGGCTNFPKAEPLFLEPSFDEHGAFKPFGRKKKTVASEQHGVQIHPKLGRAILFFSISEEPFRENPLSLHEGQTVRKGEKFICTKWLTRTEESENEEDDFVSSDEADAD